MRLQLDTPLQANVAGTQIDLTHLAELTVNIDADAKTAFIGWQTGTVDSDGEFQQFSNDNMTLADWTEEHEDGSTTEHTDFSDYMIAINSESDTEKATWEHIGTIRSQLKGTIA